MQKILVAGAGKSSYFLIQYLLKHAESLHWQVTIMDGFLPAIEEKIGGSKHGIAMVTDITDELSRRKLVAQHDLVISLMPPHLHILLAKDCIDYRKPLITASYVSDEMKELNNKAKELGLMFMCEMGLDPGIDHMTASHIFDGIKKVGGRVTKFISHCGGLVAPECDDNPWHYKISWNPRNVVVAGMSGAQFLKDGDVKIVAYKDLFKKLQTVQVPGNELLAWYPNRDSLAYKNIYDLEEVQTLKRTTLRHPDFIKGWNALVTLGVTTVNDQLSTSIKTYRQWMNGKINLEKDGSREALKNAVHKRLGAVGDAKTISLLDDLGLFGDEVIPEKSLQSSSDVLLSLIERKWHMQPHDKDRVVMHHEIEYECKGKKVKLNSSMTLLGESREKTAMAKTVGLPMAILAKLYLQKKIKAPSGVHIPIMPAIYQPVLYELANEGIVFEEKIF